MSRQRQGDEISDSAVGIESLLGQVRLLKDKYDALAAANGANFNVFALLGRETDEVHTHSAILADLLDPKGSHGQGVAFARLFPPLHGLNDDELRSATVGAEVTVDNDSRLDILIETDRSCIVIENKIYASDRKRQLERYHQYASASGKSFKVYYLTLLGDPPSKWSLGGLPDASVTCISYKKDVSDWLEDCIKEVALVPQIREILSQYHALVGKLTGKGQRNLTMELKELLEQPRGDAYNFELAPAIAEAYTELSIEAEWKFWDALCTRLVQPSESGVLLELGEIVSDAEQVSCGVLRTAYSASRGRYGYGWTFRIIPELPHAASGTQETRLRVDCDGNGLVFFGLIGVERTSDGWKLLSRSAARKLFDWWSPRLAELGVMSSTDEWLIGWCYPKQKIDLRKTTALDPSVIRTFLHGDAISPLVDEIREAVHRLVGIGVAGQR